MPDSSLDTLQLDTPRLILRVPRLADLDAFAALMADEETARFIGGVAARAVTWRALMTMIGFLQCLPCFRANAGIVVARKLTPGLDH